MPAAMKQSVADVRHEYIKERIGAVAWLEALNKLSPEEREIVAKGDEQGMCPAYVAGNLMGAIVETHFHGSRHAAEQFLFEGGRAQADKMLDGLFSVFARFVSPKQALDRAPSIISSVYTGTDPSSRIDEDGMGGALTIAGLEEYEYVAPWLSGWMQRAIERFGGDSPTVIERNWASGQTRSDELVFEARWG